MYPNYSGTYPPGYEGAAPDHEDLEQQETDKDQSSQTSPFSDYWGQQAPPWFGGYSSSGGN